MKKIIFVILLFISACNKTESPQPSQAIRVFPVWHNSSKSGFASYYNVASNGGTHTSSGKKLCDSDYVAASCHWPLGSIVRVVNAVDGRAVDVRIIDRGPFAVNKKGKAIRPLRPHPNRIIDLTPAAARCIYNLKQGITKVKIYKIK